MARAVKGPQAQVASAALQLSARSSGGAKEKRPEPMDRLAEIFDRALRDGLSALTADERELYLIQDFIISYEMEGLTGYLYNRLPDLPHLRATVSAMRSHGLDHLAKLVERATAKFELYTDPDPPTTWSDVLKKYDPRNGLGDIERAIEALQDYGLGESSIE